MDSLPIEILIHTFGFLHIEDRKNVRQVSKYWKDCCDYPAIINRERFCFRSGHCIGSIDSFLQTCKKLRSTIEFQGLKREELPTSEITWQLIGGKILSLSFIQCKMSKELIKNIILYCPNLESYKLTQFGNRFESCNIVFHLVFHEILNEFIHRNIERRKMTSLKLFLGGRQVSNDILKKIFKIFPCIRTYGIGDYSYADSQLHAFNITIFQDFINLSSIKELTINLPSNCSWLRRLADDVPQLKLRKLETICTTQSEPESTILDNLIHFLRNQPELQILKIGWVNAQDKAELSFQILSVCPELVDLRVSCRIRLEMNSFIQIWEKVSKSKLECLVFTVDLMSNPNDEIVDPLTSFTNKTLRTLKLRNCLIPENYCLPLLKHFRNLRRLEMNAASHKVLQTIFQYHVHLRELVLRPRELRTVSGFTGKSSRSTNQKKANYSISRLSKLEYLEISAYPKVHWFEEILKQINFPHLTYLRLNLCGLEKVNIESLPSVEILIIDEVPVVNNQLLSYCRQMPRLKILKAMAYSDEKKKETIKELFIIRPSLKYVIDNQWKKGYYSVGYYFDRFTKSIVEVDFKCLNFRQRVCGHLKYFPAVEDLRNEMVLDNIFQLDEQQLYDLM